tara:strand:- start:165 stop:1574 length:1410 start_codon:yes stop_codon:yes gene_type:complete
MAGEGLFFTGVVLKNNRDLLAEEVAREQLKLQKEQLELQKENAAARRRKERLDGKVNPKNYSLDNMDPFLAEQFQSQVGDYTKFVKDNSLDIQDSNELATEQSRLEGDLAISSNMYKSISSDLTSLNSLSAGSNSNNLKLAEDGTYLYQYNYNKIQEEVKSGNMTLNEALQSYPVDAESMVKQSPFTPPYLALIEEIDLDKNREVTGENKGGYNVTRITKDNKQKTEKQVASSLKINSFRGWDDNAYQRVYNNEQLEVGGNRINAKDAFFQEAYISPENPDVIGGVTSPSETLMSQLDPTKENFNKELSDQYADYLSKKIMERELANRGGKQGSKFVKDPKEEEGLSQKDIDLLTGPSKSTLSYGNVQFKFDAGMYDDVTDRNIEVNIVPESLLPGQGDLQEFFEKQYKDEVGDTNKSVKGQVTRLGLTADNVKVAAVKFGQEEYLIPYESISSEIQELKKTSVGYKVG